VIRRALLLLLVAAAIGIMIALPPRGLVVVPSATAPPALRGAMHIHTTNSDGSGTPDEVAAAAARAGLSFIILTDHGDGTRLADTATYRSGVLVIDAVEISTSGGHVIALGLPRAPYPLRGEPDDVLDDISRLGAMSIVAHPTSGKADLRWHGKDRPYDGIEWLNGDSEWRDERPATLARILFTYAFRSPEALALLLDRPDAAIRLWDAAAATHNVVGVAGSDAHARIGGDLDHGGPAALNLPSYEQSFRTFSIGLPGVTLTKNAAADARTVLDAVRAGHVFTTIDAFARPGRMSFTAQQGDRTVQAGDRLATGQPLSLAVDLDAPPGVQPAITLFRNGEAVTTGAGAHLTFDADGSAAVYRVEATIPEPGRAGLPAPWLVSNPIYVGPPIPFVQPAAPSITTSLPLDGDGVTGWAVEHSSRALGTIATVGAVTGTQLRMRYALGGARSEGPFVAFSTDGKQAAAFDRVTLSGRARQPMRVSLQLRVGAGESAGRWRRSVYLDETPRTVQLPFSSFLPVQNGLPATAPLGAVTSLLLVVDTLNTAPGSNGEFWIDEISFAR
jgi:hypothetical protein